MPIEIEDQDFRGGEIQKKMSPSWQKTAVVQQQVLDQLVADGAVSRTHVEALTEQFGKAYDKTRSPLTR